MRGGSENYSVTPELFSRFAYRLLGMLKDSGRVYDGIICPLRGGFFLSYFMSIHLKLPVNYMEISSYADKNRKEFTIKNLPELTAGYYLICDDIYDSGNTIKKIISLYPGIKFDAACLVSKKENPPGVFYAKKVSEDVWVDFFWEVM